MGHGRWSSDLPLSLQESHSDRKQPPRQAPVIDIHALCATNTISWVPFLSFTSLHCEERSKPRNRPHQCTPKRTQ